MISFILKLVNELVLEDREIKSKLSPKDEDRLNLVPVILGVFKYLQLNNWYHMTGGAGFSRQAIQASKENRNLRKIRPNQKCNPASRDIAGSNPQDLTEAIHDQHLRRTQELERKRVIYWILLIVIFLALLLLLIFS